MTEISLILCLDEAELYFPPTYRYKRGTRDTYDYIKIKRTGVSMFSSLL